MLTNPDIQTRPFNISGPVLAKRAVANTAFLENVLVTIFDPKGENPYILRSPFSLDSAVRSPWGYLVFGTAFFGSVLNINLGELIGASLIMA